MVQKSDDVHPVFPHSRDVVANLTSDELDDEVTTALVAINVEQVIGSNASANILGKNVQISKDVLPVTPEHDEPLEPGFLLSDRYEIVDLVHSGGMSHVYKAIDKRRHLSDSELIHVAIKMMRRSVAPHLNAPAALEREAAKVQRLSHPNIISVYDFDEHDGQFFLVMEWLEGETVNALLRRTRGRRLEPQFAWRVIQSIAAGVQHAHLNNVVHADINPSNVFITDTQEVKLLDFGVARDFVDPPDSSVSGIVWATRSYASPEVLSGLAPVFEDDIFALGCITYRLLSGKHPYGSLSSIDARRAGLRVQPISGLAESEAQTLNRALSYNRSDRPRTADVFAPAVPVATEVVAAMSPRIRPLSSWSWQAPLVIIAILAGTWWLSQSNRQTEEPVAATTTLANDKPTEVTAPATPDINVSGPLFSNADLAMDDARFVAPADNNARDYYREVLLIDSANPTALAGLRAISDIYVQQANADLRSEAPERASVALAVAAETDPGNPAIAIVNELLVAQGNRQLSEARLAAAEGNISRSAELLAVAERYAHLDVNEISAVRNQLAQHRQEEQLLTQPDATNEPELADAEEDAAGALVTPSALAKSAPEESTTASPPEGDAAEQTSSPEVLTVVSASLTESVSEEPTAPSLLEGDEAVETSSPEVLTVVPASLTESGSAEPMAPSLLEGDEAVQTSSPELLAVVAVPSTDSAPRESMTPSLLESDEAKQLFSPDLLAGGLAPLPASAVDLSNTEPDFVEDSGTVGSAEPPESRKLSISELGIEKYVAPLFPRSVRRRGLSGFVDVAFSVYPDGSTGAIEILNSEPGDVFNASVEKAVKKWRFTQRNDEIRANVTLRFELDR